MISFYKPYSKQGKDGIPVDCSKIRINSLDFYSLAYIKYNAKSSGIVWFRPHHYMKTNRRLEN